MTKDKRIKNELDRLNEIYKDLPEDTYTVLAPLIQNAAFMKVTLEDLQEEIRRTGPVEEYQNGANQKGRKQSAAIMAYNALIRNYDNTMKILSAKMPVVTIRERITYWPPKPQEQSQETPEERRERLHREFIESTQQLREQYPEA